MEGKTNARVRPVFGLNDDNVPSMISVISGKICARINIEDIEYVEQESRMLHIFTDECEYRVYESLGTIIDIIYMNDDFYRPMKTLIINFSKVNRISDEYIDFDSGRSIAMGRNNILKTKSSYKRYLHKYQIPPKFMQEIRAAEKIKKT